MILDLTGVFCPMGCGQTLHRMASGVISCLGPGCPDRGAAQSVLAERETGHIAYASADGCTMRHPLRERIGDGLERCSVLERVMAAGPPAGGPGTYRVTEEEGELRMEKTASTPGRAEDPGQAQAPPAIDVAAEAITGALRLAREQVTGDSPEEKERARERLADLIVRMPAANMAARPSAAELTRALGDPDGGMLRRALALWATQER